MKTTSSKVTLCADGRELTHHTGVESLDRLLNDAQPEALAIGLVCLEIAGNGSALTSKLRLCLAERLEPFTHGDLADNLDTEAETSPSRQWLAFLEGIQVGRGCPVKPAPTVQTERGRVSERDAEFIQSRRFETEDFHRLSPTAQRAYMLLRNVVDRDHVTVSREDFDSVTPCLYVNSDGINRLVEVMEAFYPKEVSRLDRAVTELMDEKLLDPVDGNLAEAA